MKAKFLALIAAVGFLVSGHTRTSAYPNSTENQASNTGTGHHPVKTDDPRYKGRTVLYFGATWCKPCKKFKAGPLKKLRSVGWVDANLREIDIDKNPKLADKYHVKSVPTFVLIDRTGKEINRYSGYMDQWDVGRFYKGSKDKRPDASDDDEPAAIPEIPYESVAKHAWRKAVVKLSTNCTGVCIDPSGVIATVLHCGTPKRVRVKINHETVYARRMYVHDDDADDCVVLFKIEGSRNDWPYVKVAKSDPVKGVTVYSLGYPGPYNKHFYQVGEGKVLGYRTYKKVRYTAVGIRCLGGNSGGPLLNSSGELVGLLCRSNSDKEPHYSLFLTRAGIEKAVSKAWKKLRVRRTAPRKTGIRDAAKRIIKAPFKLGRRLTGKAEPQQKSVIAVLTLVSPFIGPMLKPLAEYLFSTLYDVVWRVFLG